MVPKELFIALIGIGIGFLLMNYVQAFADSAVLYGIVLIVIGVLGKMFMK